MPTSGEKLHTRDTLGMTGKGVDAFFGKERVGRRSIGRERDTLVGWDVHIGSASVVGEGFSWKSEKGKSETRRNRTGREEKRGSKQERQRGSTTGFP
jgi:hypothetical protein